ncbi:MAG: class I adenylate-forming enzyme family protein [Phycisphaerales bacterium]
MSALWPILTRQLFQPTRVAVVDDQRSWRGIDLLVGALHVAEAIEKTTDAKHIGLMLPTSGLFPMAAIAGWMLGRTVVPLNYLLKGEDLQYVVDDAELGTIVTVGPMLDFLGDPPKGTPMLKLDELSFKGLPELRWPYRASADELAVILYTSGTSGRPKGVMLSHGNISSNIRQCCEWAQFDRQDVAMGVLPQFHVFGMTVLTLLPLTVGCKAIYSARFQPRKIFQLIKKHRATVFVAIPSMYNALLTTKEASRDDVASLRYLISGGEPLPDDVQDRFTERFGVTLNEGYGLTETSAVTHWCRPHEHRAHSVGKAIPGVEVRIVDETGRECGVNEDGEIRMAGPNIFRGYYELAEETERAFDEKGYFRTGDMGRVDEDGFLYITGRIKEMMIIGGENVFPREIEEVINRHPSVRASGVIGVRDPSRGEVPVAFVELEDGMEFDETSIRSHCRQFLAQYKVPRDIHHIEALPRNPTGKILRRELKVPTDAAAGA